MLRSHRQALRYREKNRPSHAVSGRPHALVGTRKAVIALSDSDGSSKTTLPTGASTPKPPKEELPKNSKPFKLGGQILNDYQTGYEPQYYEYDYYIDESWVEGNIPEDLRGTFFSVCPGLTKVFGTQVRNAADADGMVCSFSFAGGKKIFFRNKFVRTSSFQSEQIAGRRVSRGLHDKGASDGGWLFNPLDLNVRSAANSAVLHWANKLYALSAHALPHELNKTSLHTLGESEMDGLLTDTQTLAGTYRVIQSDSGAQRVALMSSQQSGPDAAVRFMELDSSGKAVSNTSHRVSGCMARMLTDFLVTDNYYVLIQAPLTFNVARFMSQYVIGEVSFAECIDFNSKQPAKLHLVPRPHMQPQDSKQTKGPLVLDLPPMASFTAVNAYETEGGNMVVADMVAQEGTPFFKDLGELVPGYYRGEPKPELTRITVDLAKKKASSQTVVHRSFEGGIVAPGRVGRPHHHVWATASAMEDALNWGPNQVIAKFNISPSLGVTPATSAPTRLNHPASVSSEVWAPGPRDFLGPPTFVPKPTALREDDGWILTMLHNAESQKAELIILDAADLSSGPVASIKLPHHIPHATGGQWVNKYLGPARGAPASWKPKQQATTQVPLDPWATTQANSTTVGGGPITEPDAPSSSSATSNPPSIPAKSYAPAKIEAQLQDSATPQPGAASLDEPEAQLQDSATPQPGAATPEEPEAQLQDSATPQPGAATPEEPEAQLQDSATPQPGVATPEEPEATKAKDAASKTTSIGGVKDEERILQLKVAEAFTVQMELKAQLADMQRRLDRMTATERALRQQVEAAALKGAQEGKEMLESAVSGEAARKLQELEAELEKLKGAREGKELLEVAVSGEAAGKLQELEAELKELTTELSKASDLERSLRLQLAESEAREKALKEQQEASTSQESQASLLAAQCLVEVEESRNQHKILSDRNAKLAALLAELEEAKLPMQVAALEGQLIDRMKEAAALQRKLEDASTQEQAIVVQLYEALADSEALQNQVDAAAAKGEEAGEQLVELKKQVDVAAAKDKEASEQLVELKKQVDVAEAVSDTAGEQLAAAKAELEQCKDELAHKEKEMRTMYSAKQHEAALLEQYKADAAKYKEELAQKEEEMGTMYSAEQYEAALVEQQELMEAEVRSQLGLLESESGAIQEAVGTASRALMGIIHQEAVAKGEGNAVSVVVTPTASKVNSTPGVASPTRTPDVVSPPEEDKTKSKTTPSASSKTNIGWNDRSKVVEKTEDVEGAGGSEGANAALGVPVVESAALLGEEGEEAADGDGVEGEKKSSLESAFEALKARTKPNKAPKGKKGTGGKGKKISE